MTGRIVGRWADDLTPPPDPAVDEQLAAISGETARFRRSVAAWVAVVAIAALLWHVVGPAITISEAAGAWIGIAVFFIVMIAVIEVASRGGRR